MCNAPRDTAYRASELDCHTCQLMHPKPCDPDLIFLRQRRVVFRLFRCTDFNGRLDALFPSGKNHDESNREEQHDEADRARQENTGMASRHQQSAPHVFLQRRAEDHAEDEWPRWTIEPLENEAERAEPGGQKDIENLAVDA